MKKLFVSVAAVIFVLNLPLASGYVNPFRGGAQRPNAEAPMIMPMITFDGNNITVMKDMMNEWQTLTGSARPVMWPLQGTDEFDQAAVWYNALNDKAYNWQYGWSVASMTLPANGWIWIELVSQSEGLMTYDRYQNKYTPIFGTNGSSNRWQWNANQNMAHNAYTVSPAYGQWSATYNVYIGDVTTRAAMTGFGSDTVTLTWTSVPEPATMTILGIGAAYLLHRNRKCRRN